MIPPPLQPGSRVQFRTLILCTKVMIKNWIMINDTFITRINSTVSTARRKYSVYKRQTIPCWLSRFTVLGRGKKGTGLCHRVTASSWGSLSWNCSFVPLRETRRCLRGIRHLPQSTTSSWCKFQSILSSLHPVSHPIKKSKLLSQWGCCLPELHW